MPHPKAEAILESPLPPSGGVNSGMLRRMRRIRKMLITVAINANNVFAFNIFLKFFLILIFRLKIFVIRSTTRFNSTYKVKDARKIASIKIIKDAICSETIR